MTETKSEQWTLEWSQKQNCFHIQTLAHSLAATQRCFMDNRQPLYVTIMVGEKEACHRMAESWRPRIRERDLARAA